MKPIGEGRPRQISVMLPRELADEVDRKRKSSKQSMSDAVREALTEWTRRQS